MSKPSYASISFHQGSLTVGTHQAGTVPNHKSHWARTPANQTPSFGSIVSIDYKPAPGTHVTDAVLEWTTGTLSGLTVSSSGTAGMVPSVFWTTKIEVFINGKSICTIQPQQLFADLQLFAANEEQRTYNNSLMGSFSSHTSRATKSAASGLWYTPLKGTVLDQAGFKFLGGDTVTFRLTMDSLANLYSLTSGSTASGTAAFPLTGLQLLTRETVLDSKELNYEMAIARKSPRHMLYLNPTWQTNTVLSGVSSTTITLNGITGPVSHLVFMLRSTSPTGSNLYTFSSTLSTFEILDGTSSSIVGGQPINSTQATLLLAPRFGVNTLTLVNDITSGLYVYSFGVDATEAHATGSHLGSRTFTGTEQLKLTFSSTLVASAQVDVFAYVNTALESSGSSVRTFSVSA